jgi:hypothetical protein
MDFTNRYAMMCQKATEIQALWMPRPCDFFIDHADLEGGFSFCSPVANIVQVADIFPGAPESEQFQQERAHVKTHSLWLPRQDQLQEIIEPNNANVHLLINKVVESRYYEPAKGDQVEAPRIFYSMEQLWLAFVMKEKNNKTWNEEDWIPVE